MERLPRQFSLHNQHMAQRRVACANLCFTISPPQILARASGTTDRRPVIGGLRDRILYKHVIGDEGHAFQRAVHGDFPGRDARREDMKASLHVQWVEISDSLAVSTVEKLAIEVLEPTRPSGRDASD